MAYNAVHISSPPALSQLWANRTQLENEQEDLLPSEVNWRNRQPLLEAHGYRLRPRYQPNWTPSWLTNGKSELRCEDSWPNSARENVLDATRISDGRLVYIKLTRTGHETDIAQSFSQPPLRDDPQNHCIPILDIFPATEYPGMSFIVMPFLRSIDDPPFYFVAEVIDFVDQILEASGLVFLHKNGVAHRDCAKSNLMMDASSMYPKGFHPIQISFLPNLDTYAPYTHRTAAYPPVKYYFIDFGLSSKHSIEGPPPLVLGIYGADEDVPELSTTVPYNPFKVDIFMLGNVFKKTIHANYANVSFLVPLFSCMTSREPGERPTAEEALAQWRKIRRGIWFWQRMRPLHAPDQGALKTVVLDIIGFFRFGLALSRRFLFWTAHWCMMLGRTTSPVAELT